MAGGSNSHMALNVPGHMPSTCKNKASATQQNLSFVVQVLRPHSHRSKT